MLTQIKLKNFKSFKNETIIDVNATNYKMLYDTNVKNKILKGLLFVGSNASGKTNAITSIKFLLELLFSNVTTNIMDYFCFFPKSAEMLLEYTFIIDEDQIIYEVIFSNNGEILKENLSLNNTKLLERIGTNANSKLTEKEYYDDKDINVNTLFLRNIYFNTKFNRFKSLQKWFGFLSNSLYVNAVNSITRPYNPDNSNLIINNYLEKYGPDKINEFFSFFGFNQKVCYENEHQISSLLKAKVSGNNKEIFFKKNNVNIWIPMSHESLGNQTLLNMLPAVLHAISNNCILLIDEFSSAFHNELEELIVRFFMNKSSSSQLFLVSHSTNLLNTTLLRPDQIYSTNFEDEQGTYLKRFSSEKPRESQNLEKMYLSGIFNGLPKYTNTPNYH